MTSPFRLSAKDVRPLATGHGGCIASARITQDGLPVRFCYREGADNDADSGWRFLSGTEDDNYMDDASNHAVYDVNTIANYDPSIIALLDAPAGAAFEKRPDATDFEPVDDWAPEEE